MNRFKDQDHATPPAGRSIKYEQTIAELKKAAATKLGVPLDKLLVGVVFSQLR